MRTDKVECDKCGAVITFSPANDILPMKSEEYKSSICPNCRGMIEGSGCPHYGCEAGHGYLSSGRSICPACGMGCYEWEDDDTPGFRDHWKGKCCKCNKNIDDWYLEQHKNNKSTTKNSV
jgi:hypothetical protein